MEKVDLDKDILFSQEALIAIDEIARRLTYASLASGGAKKEEDFPDIEGEIQDDGSLKVLFRVPIGNGWADGELVIPSDHWARKQ